VLYKVGWGPGYPGEFLRENFAGGVGVDFGVDAQARSGVAVVGEGAQGDVEASGSFFDGGFGEASDLEETAGNGGVTSGVEGRARTRVCRK